jgi:nucleotide-binding universal stress UspA family protein
MFTSIVVGTDGSDTAARAVELAAELAGTQAEATLHIVSASKPLSSAAVGMAGASAGGPVVGDAELKDDALRDLHAVLERAAAAARTKTPTVETYARLGNPSDVLCELAEQVGADLIIVGNRGMRGGRRFLGSVPNNVSHHAPCSVLIAQTA